MINALRSWLLICASAAVAVIADATTTTERIVHRCPIVAADATIGEVRLLLRNGSTVVQTLLQTVLMKRVVAEIRKKEESNWPAERPGANSARHYVSALERVQQRLWRQRTRNTRGPNPPQRLAIEFVSGPGGSWVELATFTAQGNPPNFEIETLTPLERLSLEPAYIAENLRLILLDACHLDRPRLDELLRRAVREAGR
ncbi:MAG: hypothetical protein N3C12_02420 [Candidatus Binatia bacterium]|nr:hypothetical protein [Candidatus Binatia bacterium]